MTRLEQHYRDQVTKDLQAQFSYKSAMEIPRITKITLNMGVGEAVGDKKVDRPSLQIEPAQAHRDLEGRKTSGSTVILP